MMVVRNALLSRSCYGSCSGAGVGGVCGVCVMTSGKLLASFVSTKLILIDLHLAVFLNCLGHNLAAVGFQDLVSSHLILLAILDRALAGNGTSDRASRTALTNSLRLERLNVLGILRILGQSINIRFLE